MGQEDVQSAAAREPRVAAPEDVLPLLRRFRAAGRGGGLDVGITGPGDLRDVLALHARAFGGAWDEAHALWKQWGSPAGAPISAHARRLEDGQVVASMTGVRRRVWVDGFRSDGMLTCETCSDPGLRDGGRAYKRTVEAAAVEALEGHGVWWAYGAQTTDEALRIGERWFGYRQVFVLEPLEVRLSFAPSLERRIGPAGRLLARGADRLLGLSRGGRSERWRIRPATRFGAEFDALWERHRHAYRTVVCRDARELRWRYADNPAWGHQVLLAHSVSGPSGYVIWREWQPDGPRVATVMDLWCGDDDALAVALLAAAARHAGARGCAFLRFAVQSGRVGDRAMRRLRFWRRQPGASADRVVIGPTHGLSYGRLPREAIDTLRAVQDPSGWYYTQGDCDLRD